MFKVNNRNTRTTVLLTYFIPFSGVCVVDFEHVILCWVNVSHA